MATSPYTFINEDRNNNITFAMESTDPTHESVSIENTKDTAKITNSTFIEKLEYDTNHNSSIADEICTTVVIPTTFSEENAPLPEVSETLKRIIDEVCVSDVTPNTFSDTCIPSLPDSTITNVECICRIDKSNTPLHTILDNQSHHLLKQEALHETVISHLEVSSQFEIQHKPESSIDIKQQIRPKHQCCVSYECLRTFLTKK